MIVYRVEDTEGKGPYWRNVVEDMGSVERPTLRMEGIPMDPVWDNWEYRYGFPTLTQCLHWFDRERRAMLMAAEPPFYIVKYEVPEAEVVVGKAQCVFPVADATYIDRLDFEEIESAT